jgi:hypothetical protein
MMDFSRETWQFINSFSPWLSAGAPIPENPDEYLVINIVNSGYRTAYITNIGWKFGLLKKQMDINCSILFYT